MSDLGDLKTQVQTLVDRAAISDVLTEYALGVDTRDWDNWQMLFTEDVVADYRPLFLLNGRRELVEKISARIANYVGTQHIITNHSIEIDRDRARTLAYLHGAHLTDPEAADVHWDIGGWYLHDLVRTPGGWQIARLRMQLSWVMGGSRAIGFGDAAREEARAHLAGMRLD